MPVIVRITTRTAHQRALVALGELNPDRKINLKGEFIKDKRKYVTMMPRLHGMKKKCWPAKKNWRSILKKAN